MLQVKLIIVGKVQGVFYRREAQKIAQELNLSGWVKNEPDGNVSILVQGEKTFVDQFIEWSRIGPSSAQVRKVEIINQPIQQKLEGFEIR